MVVYQIIPLTTYPTNDRLSHYPTIDGSLMIKTPTFQRPRRRGAFIEPRPAPWDCGADLLEADVHREAAGRGLRRLVVETMGGPGEWRSHGDFLWILNGFFMDFYDFEWISMIFDGCFYDFERSFH